jgi:hypothetical protein
MKLSSWDPDIRSIVNRIDAKDVDLQPDFQRQEVWPIAKKKRLIDTILREWSIPPVHFVVTTDNRLEVLDGQQRLAAIRDFLHDRFSIDANISPLDNSLKKLHGQFYSQLDPATKRKVDNYPLRGFRISEYQPEEPNELFYRLNQPTSLTAGEQRNALFGPAREQLKWLVETFQTQNNNKDSIGFSNARMAYDDIIAKFLFFLEKRDFSIRASEVLISERFKTKEGFDAEVLERAQSSLSQFSISREHAGPGRFNKASILSWLLFYSRFTAPPNPLFLSEFTSEKTRKSHRPFVSETFALFENRSSLRVADVASVVYRDFCLCYAYELIDSGPLPRIIPREQINLVRSTHELRDDATLEFILSEYLDVSKWGHSL